jgi:hypothetical protein
MKNGILAYIFLLLLSIEGSGQIRSVTASEIDEFLKKQMDMLNMPGLSIAIIRDSKIVYHRAIGVANTET